MYSKGRELGRFVLQKSPRNTGSHAWAGHSGAVLRVTPAPLETPVVSIVFAAFPLSRLALYNAKRQYQC